MAARVHAGLQLIRLPNLFTVPGDPLVGLLLGAWSVGRLSPWWMLGLWASVALYAGGLILNDLMDYEEDLRDRPERPLPSGAVYRSSAWIAYALLSLSGLLPLLIVGSSAFTLGLLLFFFVALYNVTTKHIPVMGPLTMGLCRGLSTLIGAAMLNEPLRLTYSNVAFFQLLIIYIGLVTMLAGYETRKKSPKWLGLLPAIALLIGLVALPFSVKQHTLWQDLAFSVITLVVLYEAAKIARTIFMLERTHPPFIGILVCLLIPMQAAAMVLSARPLIGLAWLLLWPFTHWLGKRFYVS